MIAMLLGLALAAPVRLDRVDLLSETSGTWLHDEAGRLGQTPTVVSLRYVEQVQVVVGVLPEGLQVGLGLGSQSLRYEALISAPWYANAGVQLRAGLPDGVVGGVAWRRGPVRLGGSLSAVSTASWARPVWDGWRVLPTIGLGIGPSIDRRGAERAPWMR